tara:strand:+ start:420 stop:629 length:210 start_codon:yes stop_codon:yes gene_type:complete
MFDNPLTNCYSINIKRIIRERKKKMSQGIVKKCFKDKNLSSTSRAWTKKYKKNANKKERSRAKNDLRNH